MIVLETLSGLCNRMGALDAGLALSKKLHQDLHVVWALDGEMPCRFDELFEPLPGIKTFSHLRHSRLRRELRRAYYYCCFSIALGPRTVERMLTANYDFEKLGERRHIAILTYKPFYPSPEPFLPFRPIRPLQKRIDRYQLGEMVGVHIRRTDHQIAIERSPTARFIELMRQEIAARGDTRFFLATDSPEEEAEMQRLFPGRIVTHAKASLNRRDPRAVQDAVVDLYCLSNCRKLIGSYISTFSETAWMIRGIDKVIVKQ